MYTVHVHIYLYVLDVYMYMNMHWACTEVHNTYIAV